MTAQCAPYIGALKYSGLPNYAPGYPPKKNLICLPCRLFMHVQSFSRDFRLEFGVEVANLQCRERSGRRGSGMVPPERALVSSYRPSIVTFPLNAFQRYCRFCYPERHFFPTPSLVSPKFSHVSLGVGGSSFGHKERMCWANSLCNLFLRFPAYMITIHQRHRRTDRRTTCDRKTALCSKVHCIAR